MVVAALPPLGFKFRALFYISIKPEVIPSCSADPYPIDLLIGEIHLAENVGAIHDHPAFVHAIVTLIPTGRAGEFAISTSHPPSTGVFDCSIQIQSNIRVV